MVARLTLHTTEPPLALPHRKRGRKSAEQIAAEEAADRRVCGWLEYQWRLTGLAFGTRGWAYRLEGEGIVDKGEFDFAEGWLARVRKTSLLDPDVVSDDESRAADNVEQVDDNDPDDYAAWVSEEADRWLGLYTPMSFWEGLDHYVETAVEKIDLKVLFDATSRRYRVALINTKGSWDINARRRMLVRFREHWRAGRKPVLLYCGDHDPAGLRISDVLKSNLMECANIRGVDFDPSVVEVVRIGLSAAQIRDLGLPWIENLITGSGKDLGDPRHPDYLKPYVQDYIRAHGERKVEANALARDPAAAAALFEAAINRYVPRDWPQRHAARLVPHIEAARAAFRRRHADDDADADDEEPDA